jgi:predicted dehydrogenase
MIKVAIIGCGKIADDHVALIRAQSNARIVGVSDREELMARQLAERFQIPFHCTDAGVLLEKTRPDVVHVTTPPQSHFDLARLSLQANAHVFVEKPFTLNATEARALIGLAREKNLKLTVHHDQQFTEPARRMRQLIAEGYLGGAPLHVESYYGYDFGGASYAKALLGDRNHWVRQLPGQLLQNIISHGVAKIAELAPSETLKVIAHGFASPFLRRIGEGEILDEIRVIASDGDRFTAYFTFSSQFKPPLHLVRVYGSKNAMEVDHDQQTLVRIRGARYPSVLEKVVPSWKYALAHAGNLTHNVLRFARRDLHPRGGSLYLVKSFYEAIFNQTPAPISDREMVLTVQIMDHIFEQVYLAPARNAASFR